LVKLLSNQLATNLLLEIEPVVLILASQLKVVILFTDDCHSN